MDKNQVIGSVLLFLGGSALGAAVMNSAMITILSKKKMLKIEKN